MMQAVMTPTHGRDHESSDAPGSKVPATQLDTNSTVSLLPLATHGNGLAAAILLERMRPYLKRIGHGKLPSWARSRAETEDLVQESLIRALRHIPRFEGQTIRDFRNWLHTVFKNLVTDEKRHAHRNGIGQELPEHIRDDTASPEEQFAEQEATDIFKAALATLDESDRPFIIYRLEHGYSFKELADTLGKTSPDAARMTYNRALKKLRTEMRRLVDGRIDPSSGR